MATTKNRSAGEAALSKAIAERERWEAALATAEGDAAAVSALVPDSPEDLDRVGERSVAARSRTEAAARGVQKARKLEADARRGLLHRIADDLEADRGDVEREARTLDRKIAQLVKQLLDVDGVTYGPALIATFDDGTTLPYEDARAANGARGSFVVPVPRHVRLATQIRESMVKEATLRYVAEHGDTPWRARDLLGTAPINDEKALERAGLAGFIAAFERPPMPEEAQDYVAWLRPAPPAPVETPEAVDEDADADDEPAYDTAGW